MFGKKYLVKLVGVDKLLWVSDKDLSKGVAKTYQADGSVVNNAKAHVDRVYVKNQQVFLSNQVHYFILFIVYHTHNLLIRSSYWLAATLLLKGFRSSCGPFKGDKAVWEMDY